MWTRLNPTVVLAAILLAQSASASTVPSAVDINGHTQPLLEPADKAVVLIFVASDCPISNRYLPEINRLQQEFSTRSVRIWNVYPNPSETDDGVHAQLKTFGINIPALLDADQHLVALAKAHFTPEAAIFIPSADGILREVYRGRIDDRYISFGHEKPAATQHDLEAAIQAVLAGKSVPPATGHPVGCSIVPISSQKSRP